MPITLICNKNSKAYTLILGEEKFKEFDYIGKDGYTYTMCFTNTFSLFTPNYDNLTMPHENKSDVCVDMNIYYMDNDLAHCKRPLLVVPDSVLYVDDYEEDVGCVYILRGKNLPQGKLGYFNLNNNNWVERFGNWLNI